MAPAFTFQSLDTQRPHHIYTVILKRKRLKRWTKKKVICSYQTRACKIMFKPKYWCKLASWGVLEFYGTVFEVLKWWISRRVPVLIFMFRFLKACRFSTHVFWTGMSRSDHVIIGNRTRSRGFRLIGIGRYLQIRTWLHIICTFQFLNCMALGGLQPFSCSMS